MCGAQTPDTPVFPPGRGFAHCRLKLECVISPCHPRSQGASTWTSTRAARSRAHVAMGAKGQFALRGTRAMACSSPPPTPGSPRSRLHVGKCQGHIHTLPDTATTTSGPPRRTSARTARPSSPGYYSTTTRPSPIYTTSRAEEASVLNVQHPLVAAEPAHVDIAVAWPRRSRNRRIKDTAAAWATSPSSSRAAEGLHGDQRV